MLAVVCVCSAALWHPHSAAQDAVCAQVKIEIKQEATLERQAFDAEMRILNGLDTSYTYQLELLNLGPSVNGVQASVVSSDPAQS